MFLTTGGAIRHMKNPDEPNERIDLEATMTNIPERYPQPSVAAILDCIEPRFMEVKLSRR